MWGQIVFQADLVKQEAENRREMQVRIYKAKRTKQQENARTASWGRGNKLAEQNGKKDNSFH